MKKLFVLGALLLGITTLFTGCGSTPDHTNMTGTWQCTYGDDSRTGTVTLTQNNYDLSGVVNSPDGQYQVTGKVMGNKFTLVADDDKKTFNASCTLTDPNDFEGDFTSNTGSSGDLVGRRIQ